MTTPHRNATRSACLALAPLLLIACTTEEAKAPITLGFVTTLAEDGTWGGEGRIAEVAVDLVNGHGGINGHPLQIEFKNDDYDEDLTVARMEELIDEGAVAEIGPIFSYLVEAAYPVARDRGFPIFSTSSTAPALSSVDDGGFMFRAVANDTVQSLAMAYYLSAVAQPAVTAVTIVYEDTSYGVGLADGFAAAFAKVGGTVVARVRFESGAPEASADAAAAVMDELDALPDHGQLIVFAGISTDGAAILWSRSERPASRDIPWFFTDGVRSADFLQALPPGCGGLMGTAPTYPTLGDSYSVLEEAYAAKYPDKSLDQESFAPNLWDTIFVYAAALTAQDAAGEPLGGAGLRDRLTDVSRGPGLILHAGQWRDIIGTARRGNSIDYDGASGPFDLDAVGEPIGPYEVWRLAPRADSYAFEQALFIDTKQIVKLRDR